jgi:ribosomal protein L7/L12
MSENIIWFIVGALLISKIIDSYLTQSEIKRLNATLDKIAKHIGVSDAVTEDINEELKNLITEGKKIKAIKRYRMVSGLGLKESKEFIDSLINTIEKK